MPDEHALTQRRGCHDEIHKEDGVEIPPALVFSELFDSSRDFDQCSFEEAQVVPSPNHRVSHISNPVAEAILSRGGSA